MHIKIDLKNYDHKNTVFKRTAARAVINYENKYLLIFSKLGDYKFPGGGVEDVEKLEDTLLREVMEETGYLLDRGSIKQYGCVYERRKGEQNDILEMESYYFFCQVHSFTGNRNLDRYEAEYDCQIGWLTLREAIERNRQIVDSHSCPWVIRELVVMESLIDRCYKRKEE